MSRDERENHAIERTVRLFEQERGLLGGETTAAGDVGDLGHKSRAEEKECLRALAKGKPVSARLDSVFAAERLGLRDELIAADRAGGVEVSQE
jgi:hypothetical protein